MLHEGGRTGWWLAGIVIVAAAVSLAVWPSHAVIGDDGVTYVTVGMNWIGGRGFVNAAGRSETNAPLLYPMLIGIVGRLVGDGALAAQLIAFASGVALLLPLYLLGSLAFGDRRVGLAAAALMAFFPLRVFYSVEQMTETPFLALALSAVALTAWILERRPAREPLWWLGAGALLGLVYLMRPAGILYAVCAAVAALVVRGAAPLGVCFKRRLVPLACAFALLATPYLLYLHQQLGRWAVTGQAWAYATADELSAGVPYHHLWRLDEAGNLVISRERRIVEEGVGGRWSRNVRRWSKNALAQLEMIATTGSPLLMLLLGIALVNATGRRSSWVANYVWAVAAVLLVALPTFFVEPRYYLPLFALLSIPAARGWLSLLDASGYRGRDTTRSWAVAAALALGLLAYDARDISRDLRWTAMEYPVELKAFGAWMREGLADRPGGVMAIKQTVPFYAGMPGVLMPHAPLAPLERHAAQRSARYLALAERERAQYHPEIGDLFDAPASRPGLRLVQVDDRYPGYRVVLYEFTQL